jgi:ubiquitin carboxyl-terminal hydrolase 36/42
MLASPLYPAPPFSTQLLSDDHSQLRPAKDIDAFNSLLPPPIEFVEGSSSGALAVAEGKYEPINGTPRASKVNNLKPLHANPTDQ